MTRQTMLAAAHRLPRSPIYGIGVCRSGNDFVDFEIAWSDFERDVEWAYAQLTAAGVTDDDHVLITTPNHENPWLSPVIHALRRIGATYTPAETYGWDATRFVSVLGRMPITVVIGLGGETLGSVAAHHQDLGQLFAGVRLIWARPEAHAQLKSSGVSSIAMALLGPAFGLATPAAPDELLINGAEWDVREVDRKVVVSSTAARHAMVSEVSTGIDGSVLERDGDTVRVRIG
jgi:hypothetical protein